MSEKEKELKAFNQCADALNALDKKSIFKVFQLLSIHFEFMPLMVNTSKGNEGNIQPPYLPENTFETADSDNDSSSSGSEKKKSTPVKRNKPVSGSSNPTFLSEFDFMPPGKESLKDFFAKYKTSSNYENNLVFIYYLQEILHENPITMDHVFSCYRHVGLKIPSFPQTLKDTKQAKGWINSLPSDLKATRAGINYLEHEMTKSDDQ